MKSIWKRSRSAKTLKARMAFILISKLYRRMYANTGIATIVPASPDPPAGQAGLQNPAVACLPDGLCLICKCLRAVKSVEPWLKRFPSTRCDSGESLNF
jgi:hypothetical protein